MKKINLYFRKPSPGYKFIPGDRHIVNFFRRWFFGKKIGGVEKVFINLCKGFGELKVNYTINLPFKKIKSGEPVVVLGVGEYALKGYSQPNPIIAGIGLMTHPSEWPSLCRDYPIVKYLQHSTWANNVYRPYYGDAICDLWFAGIDTRRWAPDEKVAKQTDFLIYNKIRWNKNERDFDLRLPILNKLKQYGFSYTEITYGNYTEKTYFRLLQQCRAMIFLCEHESQGFACCEAMAMNVPVFAWDQGYCLDPNRFLWNDPVIEATSVPFFDGTCGMAFKDFSGFENKLAKFWDYLLNSTFKPRAYVLHNLTLTKSAERMIGIIKDVYTAND